MLKLKGAGVYFSPVVECNRPTPTETPHAQLKNKKDLGFQFLHPAPAQNNLEWLIAMYDICKFC